VISALLIVLALIPAALGAAELRTVDSEEFFSRYEQARAEGVGTVLDVRTPGEFDRGRAPEALNLDFYDAAFRQSLEALDREEPYFIYCNSGNRSGRALRMMKDMGFQEVYDLSGGWSRNREALREMGE